MLLESVEIYSGKTNIAVMRHPGRKFPGFAEANSLRNALQAFEG
ncbi:DUF6959 family protein [Aestuariivirga sp.]